MDGQNKIRVLIVDDNPENRELVSKLLMFERDMEVVGTATNGQEGIAQSRALLPDIVLMDINMPDMDGIQATEIITSELPATSIIMMSVQGEQDYLRRSMLAGAREFLVKPFGSDELLKSIRHVHRLESGKKKMLYMPQGQQQQTDDEDSSGRVFAVFSPKGGVGCTTIACNLAVALKQATNKRVAVIDASLTFGDVGVVLNLLSNKTIYDLVSRIEEIDAELLSDVMIGHTSGVRVLLAPSQPEHADLVTGDLMRRVITELRKSFDYIIVDTAASFADATLSVTDVADRILLVMTLEMTSIRDIKVYLEVSNKLGYPPEKLMLLLNRADAKTMIDVQTVEATLRHKIDFSVASDPRAVSLSINQGVPLVISTRDNQVSKDMVSMAKSLAALKLGEAEEKEKDKAAPKKKEEQPQGGTRPRFRLPLTSNRG